MRILFTCLLLFGFMLSTISAQVPSQTIKGIVVDRDTKRPLIGANVSLQNTEFTVATDTDGKFRFDDVPVGRHTILCAFWRYEGLETQNIILNSAKELDLVIELSERVEEEGQDYTSNQNRPINEMSLVGARPFYIEETYRFPPSVFDPARLAMTFSGVRFKEDNDNDLLVRGNSSHGMTYRLEGVEIPNPNHFARRGSTGGGVAVMSVSVLGDSDFSTGTFSADYGNATSGIFDMHFRKGNNEKREHTVRIGLIGLDFATEGYFKKGGASYLINYRYSTLGILSRLGVYLLAPNIDNTYQDLSFNLSFPGRKRKSHVTVFGMGGISAQAARPLADTTRRFRAKDYIYEQHDSDMGVIGVTHSWNIDDKSYLKTVLAGMGQNVIFRQDSSAIPELENLVDYHELYRQYRITFHTYYNRKLNKRLTLRAGGLFNNIFYNLNNYDRRNEVDQTIINSDGSTQLIQGYTQLRYRINNRLQTNFGVHAMYLTLNNSYSIEPRFALRYAMGKGHELAVGYGLHSKMIPLGTYFVEDGNSNVLNQDLDLFKTHHATLSYDWYTENNLHLRAEAYFQYLFDVPVGAYEDSTFWLYNEIVSYANSGLVSEGTGMNYGIDLTAEKFFSRNYFIHVTGSYYRSFFTPLDGVQRSTRYDGVFNSTVMGGKEFILKKGGVLQLSARLTYTGGLRYTPGLLAESIIANDLIVDHELAYNTQAPNYWRLDARIAYRKDHKNLSYTIALDAQNATNNINDYYQRFNLITNELDFSQQAGIIPVLSFQLDF